MTGPGHLRPSPPARKQSEAGDAGDALARAPSQQRSHSWGRFLSGPAQSRAAEARLEPRFHWLRRHRPDKAPLSLRLSARGLPELADPGLPPQPALAASPLCSVLLLPQSYHLSGTPPTAGSATAQGSWTRSRTAVQHSSPGLSSSRGSTLQVCRTGASWRTQECEEGCRAEQGRCGGEEKSTQSPVAARQDPGFGPGSTPDYNVTLGLFLPFLSRDPLL